MTKKKRCCPFFSKINHVSDSRMRLVNSAYRAVAARNGVGLADAYRATFQTAAEDVAWTSPGWALRRRSAALVWEEVLREAFKERS